MIKTYGKRGVCRSTCMEFPVASMRLQLHNRKAIPNHWHACHQVSIKPIMPRHSMTLSRHQDKLLQTPATLETLGSTSAVPLHRLEAWKAACVNSWIHHHRAACGKGFISELSCRNHACRTTVEQGQPTLLASCRFQHKPSGNNLPQTPKKTGFGSKLEAKVWLQKWSHFWLRLMKQ